MKLISIVAQAGTTTPAPASKPVDPPGIVNAFPFILLGLVLLFFMMKNPRGKEQQKRNDMISRLKKGDEVQTIGGELGRVVEVRDDRILLKVDETSNTKIWYTRNAIHRVTEEKAEAK